MADLKIVNFPGNDIGDVPKGLRNLADSIERGEHGDAYNVVWVCDSGNRNVEIGLLGSAVETAPVAYYLLGLGMRELENV